MTSKIFYSIEQAARVLGASVRDVERCISRGEIQTVRLGNRAVIPADTVRWLIGKPNLYGRQLNSEPFPAPSRGNPSVEHLGAARREGRQARRKKSRNENTQARKSNRRQTFKSTVDPEINRLSIPTRSRLHRAGISTMVDLIRCTPEDLLEIPGFELGHLREVRTLLESVPDSTVNISSNVTSFESEPPPVSDASPSSSPSPWVRESPYY